MKSNELKRIRWVILICVAFLLGVGLIALYSATMGSNFGELKKQIIWLAVSMPIAIAVYIIDYRTIAKIALPLYIVAIILLGLVLLTSKVNGATSWFTIGTVSLQPGEFAKVAVIVYIAVIMEKMGKKGINNPLKLLMILGIMFFPIVLIVLQPDYGTAISYIFAVVLMLFVAGINKRYIFISIVLVTVLIPVLYIYVLPSHAKDRINVYLDPYKDPRGAGYNIIQSKLAVGGGRLLGQGYLKGTQTHLGFLYPKTTDFIFAVIGEEIGFVMCVGIVIVYVILITKIVSIAKMVNDELGSYIATGLARNITFSYNRKHWNDNRLASNYRSSSSIHKLWRKFTYY